jgi:hypothetical protein
MPLQDPEAAQRFMNFLDEAAMERRRRQPPIAQPDDSFLASPHRDGRYGAASNAAVLRELRRIHAKLSAIGLDDDSAAKVGGAAGEAAAGGIPKRIRRKPGYAREVGDGLKKQGKRSRNLTGERPNQWEV